MSHCLNPKGNTLWMDWKQWTPTLNLLSFMSLSRSLSFSARASLSKARAAIMRPLPILRAAPRRRLSFSLFSRGLIGRRAWGASAALPWHPPPKLRRCGLSMTSRSSSFNRSRGSEYNAANRGCDQYNYRNLFYIIIFLNDKHSTTECKIILWFPWHLPGILRFKGTLSSTKSFLKPSTGELRSEVGYSEACHFSGSQTPSLYQNTIGTHNLNMHN